MAKVDKFDQVERQRNNVHDSVKAEIHTFEIEGQKYLQIDTLGKINREIPGKISQSFQIDISAAKQLKQILESTFKI